VITVFVVNEVLAQTVTDATNSCAKSEEESAAERLTREEAMTKRILFTVVLTAISFGAVAAAVASKIIGNG